MYSYLVEALVKPETNYEFFTYSGKSPVEVSFRGKPYAIGKGVRFGVRKSTNGKSIRLIFPNEPTRVFTIDLPTAQKLAKGVK